MWMIALAGAALGAQSTPAGTAAAGEPPKAAVVADQPQARALLALLDSPGDAAIEAFVATNFAPPSPDSEPRADTIARLKALARDSGGVEIGEWDVGGPGVFFGGVTRKGAIPVEGMVALRDGKILGFDLQRNLRKRPADAPAWPLAAGNPPEAVAAIRREIDWRAGAGRFSGSVLVAHRGKIVLHDAWGLAARGPDSPNRADTLFHTASTTKLLTTAAVARLIDSGKLRLDMPVAEAVPALAGSPGAARATIGDLLGHRVSYGEYFEQKVAQPLLASHSSARQLMPLIAGREPEPAPEGKVAYSNANYLVLALAVEAATGQSLYDVVRDEVLRPLKLEATTYGEAARRPAGAAIGWVKDDVTDPLGLGPWRSNDKAIGSFRGGPAGGAWSTSEEMWKLLDAIAAGKLIRPDTLQAMLDQRRRVGPTLGAAQGFMFRGGDKLAYFGHAGGGGNAGMSTAAFIAPDREWAVVVLSNFSSPSGEMLAGQLLDFLAKLPR